MRDKLRLRNCSYETEKTYISWDRRYILFRDRCHPLDVGKPEPEAFLSHLIVEQDIASRHPEPSPSGDLVSIP